MNRREFLAWAAAAAATAGLIRWIRPAGGAAALAAGEPQRPRTGGIPDHHDPNGGFRNPWPTANTREEGGFWRWQREKWTKDLPPNPPPGALPRAQPAIAYPSARADELRITWVGHATFLVQIAGVNLLTDPQWSRRASPVQFAGPARFTPPGVDWAALPLIHGVLLSHDHYDHLDDRTVERLRERFGDMVHWFTPLEYRDWFRERNVRRVTELDWWEESTLDGPAGSLRIVALPCQHWTSRTPWDRSQKLWASWAVIGPGGTAAYFGGDSGYFPEYPKIAERVGPFDALMLPIGAYEPRWFMRPVHMNPEEAIRAYHDLGGRGVMLPMHWGTWRLTDEDPLEPPARTREVWDARRMRREDLQVLQHGETWIGSGGSRRT